ncbi:LysE/ArgO family amino acid transporter [Limoniibacter endophyticus]|uniref:Amino acid transporter n=1 Tax=Limoniibacter endophyticus TaxID=1565040 RepID=A0A8J3DPE6_9HYPH|nr:LysE/ArgO family amino acid transporter [Limoniibacter endophyticus]GHC68942.1 amino acid transporter [Limoniibacter endophyticus]
MNVTFFSAGLSGFFLGASLIIAIGAQNAFILRQGLLRQHVFILCLICALSDAVLIAAGVAGLGTLISRFDGLLTAVTVGGVLFLLSYGVMAFRRALNPHVLRAANEGGMSLRAAVATCLAFTFLNPHVYLDTVILVGSLSAGFEDDLRYAFGAGAMIASFVWFFTLGYGARLLQPIFARPASWRVLDAIIGAVMFLLAFMLAKPLFT